MIPHRKRLMVIAETRMAEILAAGMVNQSGRQAGWHFGLAVISSIVVDLYLYRKSLAQASAAQKVPRRSPVGVFRGHTR